MQDKSWLLNAAAIAAAKECISAIEEELGVRLKLSHPQFLQMIQQYSELTDSAVLQASYDKLNQYAMSAGVQMEPQAQAAEVAAPVVRVESIEKNASETIMVKGRSFPRFDEQGNEFKGLYRGQARYA